MIAIPPNFKARFDALLTHIIHAIVFPGGRGGSLSLELRDKWYVIRDI
jgi:hypothetical protein